jgi:aldehyde dehydrogenase (NAD+)
MSSVRTNATDASSAIERAVTPLRETFGAGRTRSLEWRLDQLNGLERFMVDREDEINAAIARDLARPAAETYVGELGLTLREVRIAQRRVPRWMRPERVRTPIFLQPGRSRIHKDPLGVVLIIGPWNYPFQLVVSPLIGALAGGNCAVVKPSEVAEHTSALLARRLPKYVDPQCVKVVEGGEVEALALLEQPFDHIFYTGSAKIARVVMRAAAEHLTPVTLELGGKSPCIVDAGVDLDVTARRIVWGKFFNAGQTCVAPDYVLAHEAIHDTLLDRLVASVRAFYGEDPAQSSDYARIVNQRHYLRLVGLLQSGEVVIGGGVDPETRYIAPTILKNVSPDAPVMQEEIFGPILPVLRVPDVGGAIDFVNGRPKPLALYLFSRQEGVRRRVLAETQSGGVTTNHVCQHFGNDRLPFGGVGDSGMGAYHGRLSFDTFTHRKAVLEKPFGLEPPLIFPPYSSTKLRWLRRLL